MRSTLYTSAVAALASIASAQYGAPLVDSESLQAKLTEQALFARAQTLEDFAYATPERNRLVGGTAHNATVKYLCDTLSETGYYNVELQEFKVLITGGNATLSINGTDYSVEIFSYTPSGSVTQELVVVANQGCDAADYPADVSGNIALISRGTCQFGLKSALAGAAGAAGAIIYNNVPGSLSGTLGPDERREGRYIPTAGLSLENGTALVAAITGGETLVADLLVNAYARNATTHNVLATTKGGDQNNVYQLGGHTDSVEAGPGINDDGSGIVALLEIATQLVSYSVTNAVRFSFWAGEEEGLLGSLYYTDNLPASELAKIRLYLNFDMIASPNYVYAVYDGDGSAFNQTGPPGSDFAEKSFIDYYTAHGIPTVPTAFDGRSDYQGFVDNGIPSGGIFTGAEGIKTAEEERLFGGEAGVAYDINYHGAGDNVANLNATAFLINSKAIADSVAQYGTSWEGIPARNGTNATEAAVGRRWQAPRRRRAPVGKTYGNIGVSKVSFPEIKVAA